MSSAAPPFSSYFADLLAALATINRERGYDETHPWRHRLTLRQTSELLDVAYHGEDELYLDGGRDVAALDVLATTLASPTIAPHLRSFRFSTPGSNAANGTCCYEIDALADSTEGYPNLTALSLDEGPGEHGFKILASKGDMYDEAGVLARVLNQAPRLERLLSPVPPSEEFFSGPAHPLLSLRVNAGYTPEGFITRLANSRCFPCLQRLTFTDASPSNGVEDFTPFADYLRLFESPLGAQLRSIRLRGVRLSHGEIRRLLTIRRRGVKIEGSADG